MSQGPNLQELIEQAREATRDLRAAFKDLKTARQEHEAYIRKINAEALQVHRDVKGEMEEGLRAGFQKTMDALWAFQDQELKKLAAQIEELRRAAEQTAPFFQEPGGLPSDSDQPVPPGYKFVPLDTCRSCGGRFASCGCGMNRPTHHYPTLDKDKRG